MPATEDYVRDPKFMHKVFCGSSVLLLGVTVWMMWADYVDEWRHYQRQAMAHIAERDKKQIAAIEARPEYRQELQAAQEKLKLAEQELAGHQTNIAAAETEVAELAKEAAATMRILRVRRAQRDVDRATYGLQVRDNVAAAIQQEYLDKFNASQEAATEYEVKYADQADSLVRAKAKLGELTAVKDNAEKALKATKADVARLTAAINKIEPSNPFSAFKRDLMLLPIIDGFNSPERVQQDWLPNLKIDLGGMTKVDRFDRCRTCHYAIDRVAAGTEPAFPYSPHGDGKEGTYGHPFASHPRLDLFLSSASPHPLPKFGCTVCHEGQGSGTSFQNASHAPNDPLEEHTWQHDHKWFDNHFWERPMLPERFRESTCIKCHVNVTELGTNSRFGASAPKVVQGYNLVKTYGCFGCHEIHGFEAGQPIGPDLRLEPGTPEELAKIAEDPKQVAGQMRKVGPSLRHLASKAEAGWIENWTEVPKNFRPSTRMPQFFQLSNQRDHLAEKFNPLELAGMAQYLLTKSQPLDVMAPKEGYQPSAQRGQEFFATKGCVACHTHADMPGIAADFGPDLSRIHAKIKPGKAGYDWLYTWIREPERHHPRTKMPHLYLEPEGTGEKYVDPAADIAAFLLKLEGTPADFKTTAEYPVNAVNDADLEELVRSFLGKILTQNQITEVLKTGVYPLPAEKVKGDEIELISATGGDLDAEEWRQRKLVYVGRKTITKYGCYGCHDIPNFESARPIGTALQDWGKKDTARLAFEHIHEFLHHHGQPGLGMELETIAAEDAQRLKLEGTAGVRVTAAEPGVNPIPAMQDVDGTPQPVTLSVDDVVLSYDNIAIADLDQLQDLLRKTIPGAKTPLTIWRDGRELSLTAWPDGSLEERVQSNLLAAERGELHGADEQRELSAAFYYESLGHHGRPGFLWQKLRQPRSYDFKMTETKPYDDRLRMPKFPFSEEQIDAIATFILGLRAEPPGPDYLHRPTGPKGAIIRGEQLIEKFNCSSCHLLELPQIRYGADLEELTSSDADAEFPQAIELLNRLKPPRSGLTKETVVVKSGDETKTLPVVAFHGLMVATPDPEDDPEDQEYVAELWENLKVGDTSLFPTSKMIFPAAALQGIHPARGGKYAEWLAQRLTESRQVKQLSLGYQAAPPPLYLEGHKVQTPWLFNFLRNPTQIRHTTVLRMPRFNMSSEEAQDLANYFAAVDGAAYPYQPIPQREAPYVAAADAGFRTEFPGKGHDYLTESWKVLNSPLCVKCHAVGGRVPMSTDPANDIRAPNLDMAGDRLRPDWMLLWLYRPTWITPYTSMPQNFPRGKENLVELFGGQGDLQTQAVRDALVNYHRLMERDGRIVYDPMVAPAAAAPQTANRTGDAAVETSTTAGTN
ncbi:MAG: c-type cytochrome [Planctomycetaceae bacterium]|nr:c-type cytochrome [Planctomycetaceae bacterium]